MNAKYLLLFQSVYKAEKHLHRCIESILAQTLTMKAM